MSDLERLRFITRSYFYKIQEALDKSAADGFTLNGFTVNGLAPNSARASVQESLEALESPLDFRSALTYPCYPG